MGVRHLLAPPLRESRQVHKGLLSSLQWDAVRLRRREHSERYFEVPFELHRARRDERAIEGSPVRS